MIKKILVTGSSGTIGTRLCETLMAKGYEVVGCDWMPNKFNKAVAKITLDVDLRDKAKTMANLPKDVDMVIHLAANARVFDLVVEPDRARDNMETTFNILEYVRLNGIKRIAFASSREVYGNMENPVHAEGDERIHGCESPYTASKIAGEALMWAYQRCYGIDIVIYRFSNVYGMYDESNRFIPIMIGKAAKGETMTIFGKDKMLDFTYIDDTISGITLTIEKFDSLKEDVYNIACGEGARLLDVAQMIKEEMGSQSEIALGENRTGEIVQYIADITKAKDKVCYEPHTKIREGVRRSVEWYRKFWNL